MSAVSKIGLLTSGGDAPGMNAAIRAVVRTAQTKGIRVLGIRRGYNGLISGDVFELDASLVSGITNQGGTILYTARSPEFHKKEGLDKAHKTCKHMGIDGIICIGGDGTFRGAKDLSEYGVSVCGIPSTIDNDIACTNYAIGFDTAANTAIEAIDRLRDTMQSHERCSLVEVMGHRAGHLAVYVGIGVGANVILTPEREVDLERDVIEEIREARIRGRTHFIIIVAEGRYNLQELSEHINQETGIDSRITILGHIQRGGSPTARDRVTASRMGKYAVELLADGKRNRVVGTKDGALHDFDIVDALNMEKGLEEAMYEVAQTLCRI